MQNKKLFVLNVIFLLVVLNNADARKSESHPNVVIILADDLGWKDLGYMGSETYETPNIDKLASEGMVFTDFYAAGPVCSPTRASILTGKSPARTGITTYLITPDQDPDYITHQLELSEYTIAEAFAKHGYTTGLFGKWHLGYDMEHWAANQGFQTAIGGTTSRNAWRLAYPDREPPVDQLEVRYFSPHYLTHMKDGPKGEYITDRLTNETIKFIEKHKQNPFFAFLSFHTVHTPLEAKEDIIEKYRKKFEEKELLWKGDVEEFGSRKYQNLPEYAAMVHHMDENVGRLLDKIEALGLRENTIVIFTSDNGGKGSVTSNAPLRGAKHNLYEGGIRVPFIIRYPGYTTSGSQSSFPVISHDIYPTLLDMANLPLEPQQHKDGISFKSIITGKRDNLNRKALFWHYPHNRFEGAVRWKNYKLIYEYKTGESELYNLVKDIRERNDISEDNYSLVRKLENKLAKWLKDTSAKFPNGNIVMPTEKVSAL